MIRKKSRHRLLSKSRARGAKKNKKEGLCKGCIYNLENLRDFCNMKRKQGAHLVMKIFYSLQYVERHPEDFYVVGLKWADDNCFYFSRKTYYCFSEPSSETTRKHMRDYFEKVDIQDKRHIPQLKRHKLWRCKFHVFSRQAKESDIMVYLELKKKWGSRNSGIDAIVREDVPRSMFDDDILYSRAVSIYKEALTEWKTSQTVNDCLARDRENAFSYFGREDGTVVETLKQAALLGDGFEKVCNKNYGNFGRRGNFIIRSSDSGLYYFHAMSGVRVPVIYNTKVLKDSGRFVIRDSPELKFDTMGELFEELCRRYPPRNYFLQCFPELGSIPIIDIPPHYIPTDLIMPCSHEFINYSQVDFLIESSQERSDNSQTCLGGSHQATL